jgi:magnesium-protoporphyrin O-methyltransferase
MVAFLEDQGLVGATVLEIGGGVGELQVELLRRGAARATNLEVASAYETEAARLLASAGLTGRVQRRHLDIVEAPEQVEPADVVVLHRVVCCYDDYERLLAAAGSHARRALVFSHPPRNAGSRAYMTMQNAILGLLGKDYRGFTHPPAEMIRVLRDQGLSPAYTHRGSVWHVAGLTR